MKLIEQACHSAAVASHKAEIAAGTLARVNNMGRYAMPRARDYQDRYGAALAAMAAVGATEAEMVARIQEDGLVGPAEPVSRRPALTDLTGIGATVVQGEFEEPVAEVVAIDPRRHLASVRASLKQQADDVEQAQ